MQSTLRSSSTIEPEEDKQYDCKICKDEEWIYDRDNNSARPCNCREVKLYKRILEGSGITGAFLMKTFENYKPFSKHTEKAYITSLDYCNRFTEIRDTKNNSIALLGAVGSGKTHLSIAIANKLMEQNIGVRYMQYREDVPKIKQLITDEEQYSKEMNKYKNCTVLLIDDLYKNAIGRGPNGEYVNEADKRLMFEIINHRYFVGLPMIVSSEYKIDKLLDFDEAIGSRILEMSKGHIVEIVGLENNYRLRG